SAANTFQCSFFWRRVMRNAKSRRGNQILAAAVGAVGVMGLATMAYGGVAKTWTGLGGDNNWKTAANWKDGASFNADDGVLTFTGTPPRTASYDNAGYAGVNGIDFSADATEFTISGDKFIIRNTNIRSNSTRNQTINNDILVDTASPVSMTGTTGTLTFNGALTSSGSMSWDFQGPATTGAGGETPTVVLGSSSNDWATTAYISQNITVQMGPTGKVPRYRPLTFKMTGKEVLDLGGTTQTLDYDAARPLTFSGTVQ
ncbi:MAG: hypothetical protein K8T25_08675, partial [Planctomycetia bacterium]|nr:hypothetical protein [Planctomycetia bacterium]